MMDENREAQRLKFARRTKQLAHSYKNVFDTPDGKRVLFHILKTGHVFTPSFVPGDAHMTSLLEGERRMALSILRMVAKDDSEMQQTIMEAMNDATQNLI